MTPRVEVHPTPEVLSTAVAGALLARLAAIQGSGRAPHVVLTGGTVARSVYREVSRLTADADVDWANVVLWWGDERFVERSSPERNEAQASTDLLAGLSGVRVHPVPSTDDVPDVEAAATQYADLIRESAPDVFDIVLLGVGPDGHVASLFPGSPQLDVVDDPTVAVRDSPKPPSDRVSLTLTRLNRTAAVWFLVSGAEKADAVAAAQAETGEVQITPARGAAGLEETTWFLDADAASAL